MPLPSITKACPECAGNLSRVATHNHPERRGYTIHTYECSDHGPIVFVTAPTDTEWPATWVNSPDGEYIRE